MKLCLAEGSKNYINNRLTLQLQAKSTKRAWQAQSKQKYESVKVKR